MGRRRQKIQLELAFMAESRGEAPRAATRGTELPKAKREPESPIRAERLMEEVVDPSNLWKALKRVKANKGSPGVDGMIVEDLSGYLREQWPTHREHLLAGTYKPQPVRRVEIPKPSGGVRKLGVPTVLDRLIQQAVLQVLQPRWDRTFSKHSYGFRPGRSAHKAVSHAQQYIAQGHRYVVDMDLEKFFDRVNHDLLMGRIAKRVADKRLLKLIRAFLNAGVMENGLVSPTDEGTPQGGPLSPLLSNIVLDDLDRELEKRGHCFVRYADDSNIYVRSERAGQRVMESITDFVEKKLKLKVNREKSAVDRPWRRKFLGFTFTHHRDPRRRIAPGSLDRFRKKVRELTRRTRGKSLSQVVKELEPYLRGWLAYFGQCQTPSVLHKLESWLHRRLRQLVWKQWKRGRTRFVELRRRGLNTYQAAVAAGSPTGPWRMAKHPTVHTALPRRYFHELGLPRLAVRRV